MRSEIRDTAWPSRWTVIPGTSKGLVVRKEGVGGRRHETSVRVLQRVVFFGQITDADSSAVSD